MRIIQALKKAIYQNLLLQKQKLPPGKKNNHGVDFYSNYFSLIASGARLKLVEAMFRLNLFSLFTENSQVLERDLILQLGLAPKPAQKWLHLLCSEHFLVQTRVNRQTAYELPPPFLKLLQSDHYWPMYFFYNGVWMENANKDLARALQDASITMDWPWPPTSHEQAAYLETWMTKTAKQTLNCIFEHFDFTQVQSLLDVGGGDGTMACNFVHHYPHLKATVYNLEHSSQLAKENIASYNLSQKVDVHVGDFLKADAFPKGADCILFARVLMDWGFSTCTKLITMAYNALPKGGFIVICELFRDISKDTCLACEYGYIFNDDFDVIVLKNTADYRRLLEKAGFTICTISKKTSHSKCAVIVAQK